MASVPRLTLDRSESGPDGVRTAGMNRTYGPGPGFEPDAVRTGLLTGLLLEQQAALSAKSQSPPQSLEHKP